MGWLARTLILGSLVLGSLALPASMSAASGADETEWIDDPSWADIAVTSSGFDRAVTALLVVEEELETLVDRAERAQRLREELVVSALAHDEAVALHHSTAVEFEKSRVEAVDERVELAIARYVGIGSQEAAGIAGPEPERRRTLSQVYGNSVDEDRAVVAADSTIRRDEAAAALARAEADRARTLHQLDQVTATQGQAEAEASILHETREELITERDDLRWTAEVVGSDVPLLMLVAYHRAASTLGEEQPSCRISWTLLAGVGRAESNHARFGGAQVDLAGDLDRRIVGPRLDGVEFQEIFDTDGGRLDGDTEYDRAVGPMQFIPGTWRSFARDGDGDGDRDPQNVFDATLAAADYLCRSAPLVGTDRLRVALASYNRSEVYGQAVLDSWARYEALGLDPEEPWFGGPVPEKLAYLPDGAADGLDSVSP